MHVIRNEIAALILAALGTTVTIFPAAAQSHPPQMCPPSDDCARFYWAPNDGSCGIQSSPDGTACSVNGKTGTCFNGTCNNCKAPVSTGTLFPKYLVIGLIYSPPGSGTISQVQGVPSKCSSASFVDYTSSSSLGTTISTEDSFSQDYSLTVTSSMPLPIDEASISGGFSTTGTTATSQTISKGQKIEIKGLGNCDGLDHDQDAFILLLNPAIAVYTGELFRPQNGKVCVATAQWSAGVSSSTGTAQWYVVYVKWLKDPSTMPANVAQQLKSLGFTVDDYNAILLLDPFASGPTTIDSSRFLATTTTFPYENPTTDPVCNNGVCSCLAFSGTLTNALQTKNASTSTTKYSVGFTESTGFDVGVLSLEAKASEKFTWTASTSTTNITDSSQSALATVECPSTNYNGLTLMGVYWDSLFGSFMFQAVTAGHMALLHQGHVADKSGRPLQYQAIDLSYGGVTYHTFTNRSGNFSFYGRKELSLPKNAEGTLAVAGHKQKVAVGASATSKFALK
jgi:hypothetical protein